MEDPALQRPTLLNNVSDEVQGPQQIFESMQIDQQLDDIEAQTQRRCRWQVLLQPIAVVAVFLALMNLASGLTAKQGDHWKLTFLGLVLHLICRFITLTSC
jgi:hypothetical protein